MVTKGRHNFPSPLGEENLAPSVITSHIVNSKNRSTTLDIYGENKKDQEENIA